MTRRARIARWATVVVLLAASHAVQLYDLREHAQPILFGDAQGYFVVGQRFTHAWAAWRDGVPLAEAAAPIRGILYFSGVGILYALVDALRPGDIPFAREVLALFNTLSAVGVFLLARRLCGHTGWALLALGAAAVYPPFSLQTGRLLPDPVTGCAFVFSAWLFAEGLARRRAVPMALSGLAFTTGLCVRSQLYSYAIVLVALVAAASARIWWRQPGARRLAGALLLGMLPLTAAWAAVVVTTGNDLSEIEALGNFTFRQRYPYGFWQFLDSDGWMGPYRLEEEPYFRALEEAASADPELMGSRPRQLAFTMGYVLSRPIESALLVLDNAWRLYDRPANDFKRDYPFPYPQQVGLQRGIVLLALVGAAWLGTRRPALLATLFVPAVLALLHGLSYPWPRFNQPAMPILLAWAAVGASALAGAPVLRRGPLTRPTAPVALAAAGAVLLLAGLVLRLPAPEWARGLRLLGVLSLLVAPFAAVLPPKDARHHAWPILLGAHVALLFAAHAARDRRWHEVATPLAEVRRVEQEIDLDSAALAALRAAPELFLALDLHLPGGSPRGLRLEVAGHSFPGEALEPTMPRFGESTAAGARNRLEYPMWWALRLEPEWLPRAPGRLRVVLEAPAGLEAQLGGDRFSGQQEVYEGPSLGDWPHRSAVKLEYDGDYRLPVMLPLASSGTRSWVGDGSRRRPVAWAHRIRIVALEDRRGRVAWETPPAPPERRAAFGFNAYSGTRGQARLSVGEGAPLELPLGGSEPFDSIGDGARLCYRPGEPRGGMAYGGYQLVLDALEPGRPVPLRLSFRPGMSDEGMFFSLDRRKEPAPDLAVACGIPADTPRLPGIGQILDADRNSHPDATGRWAVAGVY